MIEDLPLIYERYSEWYDEHDSKRYEFHFAHSNLRPEKFLDYVPHERRKHLEKPKLILYVDNIQWIVPLIRNSENRFPKR